MKVYTLDKYHWIVFSLFYWICALFIWFNFNGTGGEADSINHYLYAKYAFKHPDNFLNHWAKPFYTLIAAPIAHFGFSWIKFLNILLVYGASFFTYKIAGHLKLKHPILAPIFYFLFPLSFTTTFSALTEPLSAFMLMLSLLLMLRNRLVIAAIIISFLPFVRTEGLLFIGVFGLFLTYHKKWKALLLLSVGHVFYSCVGIIFKNDLLWVFTEIPYAFFSSPYGNGTLYHFAEKLNYIMGIPLLVLFLLGLLSIVMVRTFRTQKFLLITALFLFFFIAHTLFWYWGIFNSMGLKRVFASITPIMALICLTGYQVVFRLNSVYFRKIIQVSIWLVIFLFPFTKNPAAIDWQDLNLSVAQQNAQRIQSFIKKENLEQNRKIYSDPFLSEILQVNPFNSKVYQTLAIKVVHLSVDQYIIFKNYQFHYQTPPKQAYREFTFTPKKGDVIIWDNWHSIIDFDVQENDMSQFELLETFSLGQSFYKVYLYSN